jgi:hypothetical protein
MTLDPTATNLFIVETEQELLDRLWAGARDGNEQNALNVLFHRGGGWARSWAIHQVRGIGAPVPIIRTDGEHAHIDWEQAEQIAENSRDFHRQSHAFLRAAIQLAAGNRLDYDALGLDQHGRQTIREIVAFWFDSYDTVIDAPTSGVASEIANDMLFHLDQKQWFWGFWDYQAIRVLTPYFLAASIGQRIVADVHTWITQRDSAPGAPTSYVSNLLRVPSNDDAARTLQLFETHTAMKDMIDQSYALADKALIASVRTRQTIRTATKNLRLHNQNGQGPQQWNLNNKPTPDQKAGRSQHGRNAT